MTEDTTAAVVAELQGLRQDLLASTDRLVERIEANGKRIEANGKRIEANGKRIEANGKRIDALADRVERIDDRLYAVESTMPWFREQVLTLSRQLTNAVIGRSRIEHDVDGLRESVAQLGARVEALEGASE